MITVNLDSTKFEELIRCLSLLKDLCNDIDLRNGIIRQKTNDSSAIFEIDLSSILTNNMSMAISHLKEKLDLIKTFVGQEVIIENSGEGKDKATTFSDLYSSLKMLDPDYDFLDNKFIPDTEFERLTSLNENELMMNTSIIKTISDRIKVITQGFHVNNIQVIFEGEKGLIAAITQSKDQFAKLMTNIDLEEDIKGIANIVSIPFIIDHDGDINFQMFRSSHDRALGKFSTTISDININIYTRSPIIEQTEELEDDGVDEENE